VLDLSESAPIILCIDDYVNAGVIRKVMLESQGYRVIIAESGEQGLEIVRNQHVDLVISDHYLQGKTGAQIACEMKATQPSLPIILLSGAVERPEGSEYADAFLCKAEPPAALFETISQLLKHRAAASSGA
jgi:CheY-like chemotaxis protein